MGTSVGSEKERLSIGESVTTSPGASVGTAEGTGDVPFVLFELGANVGTAEGVGDVPFVLFELGANVGTAEGVGDVPFVLFELGTDVGTAEGDGKVTLALVGAWLGENVVPLKLVGALLGIEEGWADWSKAPRTWPVPLRGYHKSFCPIPSQLALVSFANVYIANQPESPAPAVAAAQHSTGRSKSSKWSNGAQKIFLLESLITGVVSTGDHMSLP